MVNFLSYILGNSFLKGMHLYLVRMKLVHPVKSGELAVS